MRNGSRKQQLMQLLERPLFFLSARYSFLARLDREGFRWKIGCPVLSFCLIWIKIRGLSFLIFFYLAVQSEANAIFLGKAWNWPCKRNVT